jgi:predicted Zn-dependent peptidase
MRLRSILPLALGLLAGCEASAPPLPITGVVIPVEDTTPHKRRVRREAPPPSGPAKPYRFPRVVWSELPSGLKVATIPSRGLPMVEIRVVVEAGRSTEGEQPGIARLTAHLLEEGGAGGLSGRDLMAKIAGLGSDLSIDVGFDAVTFGLAVTRDRLGEALSLLGSVIASPSLSPADFDKLKKREADRLASDAKARGAWGATRVLYSDLFALPSEHHPYATSSATASEVTRLTAVAARGFYERFYVPRSTFVVVAGDAAPEEAAALATKAFAGFRGGDPPAISFTDPNPPAARRITLVDRPHSSQSDVYVGALGPARADRSFTAFAVATQILGGGSAGRLFADVREKDSLAYSASASITELAHGPSVLIAHAGTQTASTGLALQGLLDHLEEIAHTAASDDEVAAAQRFLSDSFAVRLEAVGAIARELAHLHVLGLPDDHDDGYRKELSEITAPLALKAASDHLRPGHEVVVVAGDAAVVGPMLSHFGEVKVVDPTRDFARVRSIPMNPDAPLAIPRKEGQ